MPLRTIEALLAKKRATHPELRDCCLSLASLHRVCAREHIDVREVAPDVSRAFVYDGAVTILLSRNDRECRVYQLLRALARHWLTKGQEPESRCEADNADADAEMFCGLVLRRAEHFNPTVVRRVAMVAARASLIAMAACAPYGVDRLLKAVGYDGDSFARHVAPSHTRSPIPLKPMRMRG